MGKLGRVIAPIGGAIIGGLFGGPVGAGIGATVGGTIGQAFQKSGGIGGVTKPPPVITEAPQNQQIANRMPPINFAQIMDTISGSNLSLIRGTDGKIQLSMGGGNRIPVDAPINLNNVNTRLPAIRQVQGRDLTVNAGAIIALSQAMSQLTGTIEQMEKTNPYLIEQNKEFLSSFKEAQQLALDKGFDIRQNSIDAKLTRMGLLNSSTALGVQVALARERAEAEVKVNFEQAALAQSLKQQSLDNMFNRGNLIGKNAEVEIGRFTAESSNQLALRQQDIQANLAAQELEQRRAMGEAGLQLSKNDQLLKAELGRRQLQADQSSKMASIGLDLINNTNNQALAARGLDNQAIANSNSAQYDRFRLTRNPWKKAAQMAGSSFATHAAQALGDRIFDGDTIKQPTK